MYTFFEKFSRNQILAVDDQSRIYTYSDFNKFGFGLERSLIFIICKNSIEALFGYLYCIENKIVPLLLSDSIDKKLFDQLMHDYHPSHIWAPKDFCSEETKGIYEYLDYTLYETNMTNFPMHKDLALLLTTSGSTGSPKLVRQSYKNIFVNAASIASYLELDGDERPITTLPLNYTYGLSIINSHLLVGASILLTSYSIVNKEFWDFFREEKATSLAGVPYTYEILDKLRFTRMSLPSLKTMTQAGGKLSSKLHEKFASECQRRGIKFFIMYGATEATARMGYLPWEKSIEKCGSIGIPIPGGSFSIVDEDGNSKDEAERVGELVYYGENVTMGYATRGEELSLEDSFKGVYYTGDMAKKDRDGFYYIVGRKKRFLKLFGNRVSLDESENLIKTELDIECACFGVDDLMKIAILEDTHPDLVLAYISRKTGLNSKGFQIIQLSEIPKNSSGKTDYVRLANEN